jgi:N-acetylglucosaminyl-diphospho-decaprenol L-rhamnosyltransferase
MKKEEEQNYAVVVVSFGSGEVLESFVESLESSKIKPKVVVVVENGPELNPISQTTEFPLNYIHLPGNPGYGTAINAGFNDLPAEISWVLISNPDVILEPESVDILLATTRHFPGAGAFGPRLLNLDGTIYPSARALPSINLGVGHALTGAIWPTNPWTTRYLGRYDSLLPRECGWLSGACLLVKRHAFEQIGGFDTGYFMFMEDVDLGMRLAQSGWGSIYVPRSVASHTVGHSTKGSKKNMVKAHHQSAKRFISKRYPGVLWSPIRWALGVGLTLRQWVVQSLGK